MLKSKHTFTSILLSRSHHNSMIHHFFPLFFLYSSPFTLIFTEQILQKLLNQEISTCLILEFLSISSDLARNKEKIYINRHARVQSQPGRWDIEFTSI